MRVVLDKAANEFILSIADEAVRSAVIQLTNVAETAKSIKNDPAFSEHVVTLVERAAEDIKADLANSKSYYFKFLKGMVREQVEDALEREILAEAKKVIARRNTKALKG